LTIKAKKSLGQNFLQDNTILNKIITAGDVNSEDKVIEIGPGLGALTELLLARNCNLTAIELDDRLIPILNNKFANRGNFELLHMNALDYIPPNEPYKVIANIPYYITSPLINHFLSKQSLKNQQLPETIVILIQKEVAEKICSEKSSVISLMVKLFGDVELVTKVPAKAFKPAPKVDSAVIKISNIKDPKLAQLEDFFRLTKACFLNPRKTIKNNLQHYQTLKAKEINPDKIFNQLGINPIQRPETLSLADWLNLHKLINLP
jgi:16S rRNA (adenine1518-N6/adenine1519-N6)-dimethyltransferase